METELLKDYSFRALVIRIINIHKCLAVNQKNMVDCFTAWNRFWYTIYRYAYEHNRRQYLRDVCYVWRNGRDDGFPPIQREVPLTGQGHQVFVLRFRSRS